jgi:hypothetical protein
MEDRKPHYLATHRYSVSQLPMLWRVQTELHLSRDSSSAILTDRIVSLLTSAHATPAFLLNNYVGVLEWMDRLMLPCR